MSTRHRTLLNLIAGSWTSDALATAVELKLPDLVAGGPRTAADLANATDCEPGSLSRLLRALVTIDICVEEPDGAFTITPMGARLREDHPQSLHFWSIYWAHSMRPLWNHLSESVRTGQSVRRRSPASTASNGSNGILPRPCSSTRRWSS